LTDVVRRHVVTED